MKYIFFAIVFGLSFNFAHAETISGRVFGENRSGEKTALVNASIRALGTNKGAITNANGEFSINMPSGANQLIVSYVGFESDTVAVNSNMSNIEIVLQSSLETDEIEVVDSQESMYSNDIKGQRVDFISSRGLRKAACCNLSESFVTNASVDVQFSDAVTGAKQIELLGLAGKYTQILTDKTQNIRGLGSTFGLSYIPGPWMEAIAISKGVASVTTGYESMTGQINVSLINPDNAPPVNLNLYGNEMGKIEGNVNLVKSFNDELSSLLLIHGSTLQSSHDLNNDTFIDMPLTNMLNVVNRWTLEQDNGHAMLNANAMFEERGGGQVDFQNGSNPDAYGIDINTQRFELSGKRGYIFDTPNHQSIAVIASALSHWQQSSFGHRAFNGKEFTLNLNAIYELAFSLQNHEDEHELHEDEHELHEDEHELHEDEHELHEDEHELHEDEHELHEDEHTEPSYPHNLTLGLSYIYDDYQQKYKAGENTDFIDIPREESVPGIYVEYSYTGFEKLTLTAGLRSDFHNIYGNFLKPTFHASYNVIDGLTLRGSAGKGYRVPNLYSENIGLMASSRDFNIIGDIDPEEAWNYGINTTYDVEIGGIPFTFNAEYYRTNFINQLIVDLEQSSRDVYFYNLDGESYSNSIQTDVLFEPVERLQVLLAYRFIDVWQTIHNELRQKPLQSLHKGFINLQYSTEKESWQFDFTAQYNGKGRLPESGRIAGYYTDDFFPAYVLMFGQITKNFSNFSIYAGVENLTDYTQEHPIYGYENPFGDNFDSSIIWGPIVGRKIYLGVRYKI